MNLLEEYTGGSGVLYKLVLVLVIWTAEPDTETALQNL